jgi:hypothetical protein
MRPSALHVLRRPHPGVDLRARLILATPVPRYRLEARAAVEATRFGSAELTKSSTRGAWLPAVVIRTFGRVASCSRVARKAKEEISQPAFWTWPSSLTA